MISKSSYLLNLSSHLSHLRSKINYGHCNREKGQHPMLLSWNEMIEILSRTHSMLLLLRMLMNIKRQLGWKWLALAFPITFHSFTNYKLNGELSHVSWQLYDRVKPVSQLHKLSGCLSHVSLYYWVKPAQIGSLLIHNFFFLRQHQHF